MNEHLIILWAAFFLLLIWKLPFFDLGFPNRLTLSALFVFKVLGGLLFYYIYTYHYTYRFTSDSWKFYSDGVLLHRLFYEDPGNFFKVLFGLQGQDPEILAYLNKLNFWYLEDGSSFYNDSRSVIRFNSVAFFVSRGQPMVHTLIMCFMGFTGLTALYKAVLPKYPGKDIFLILIIFLIPSVWFWTGGVIKEGLVIFSLGWFVYFLLKSTEGSTVQVRDAVLCLVFLFLVILSKMYVGLALVPGTAAMFAGRVKMLRRVPSALRFAGVTAFLFLAGLGVFKAKNIDPLFSLSQKQRDFINLSRGGYYFETMNSAKDTLHVELKDSMNLVKTDTLYSLKPGATYYVWVGGRSKDTLKANDSLPLLHKIIELKEAGSRIKIGELKPTWGSLLSNLPAALFNTLFRPLPGDANNAFSWLSVLENLLFVGFVLFAVFRFTPVSAQNRDWLWFCVLFCLILFSLIGLTTPVLGAMVRYKVPALPFLLMAILLMMRVEKLKFLQRWNRP